MFPNFLCIGAQKAGTTWLYRNLDHHPDVWMPPVKEIHYFDRSSLPLIIHRCHLTHIRMQGDVLRGLTKRTKPAREQPPVDNNGILRTSQKPKTIQNSLWGLRFLLLPRTDKWYESLFSPGVGRVTGDITPYYATLATDRVTHIYDLMPEAKIIYVLRNPIHRLWSQAAMHLCKGGFAGLATIGEEQTREFLEKQIPRRHSDYLRNLRTWSIYPQQQFFIGFFDQLVQNPHSFLRDVYRFLDLDASEQSIPKTVSEKRNAGQYPAIPEHFARYLARQYYEQIKQLHRRFNNQYTAGWLDSANHYL
jgi:sulfotransferase family protein